MIPEARFLLASLRSPGKEAPSSIDWDALLRLAESHRVLPLFCRSYGGKLPERVSASWRNQWAMSQSFATELENLLTDFGRQNIDVITLKGPVLGEMLYGGVTQRPCDDLDLLVKPGDFECAQSHLLEQGFLPASEVDDYHRDFERRGTFVELHFGIGSRSYSRFDMAGAWHRATTTMFRGRSAPIFSPCDLILYLSLHGLKHHFARLLWIFDIARALQTLEEIDACQLFDHACAYDHKNVLLMSCELARQSFGVELPEKIAEAIAARPAIATDAATMLNKILLTEADPRTSVNDLSYHLRLADNHRQRWKQRYRFFLPTSQDQVFVTRHRLSPRLAPVLRPFRLLVKYGPATALRALFPGYFGLAETQDPARQPGPE